MNIKYISTLPLRLVIVELFVIIYRTQQRPRYTIQGSFLCLSVCTAKDAVYGTSLYLLILYIWLLCNKYVYAFIYFLNINSIRILCPYHFYFKISSMCSPCHVRSKGKIFQWFWFCIALFLYFAVIQFHLSSSFYFLGIKMPLLSKGNSDSKILQLRCTSEKNVRLVKTFEGDLVREYVNDAACNIMRFFRRLVSCVC